jgi:RNA polymerase primary sigma factor
MVELLSKWRKMTAQLQDELGRTPTQEEVAKKLEISKKKLRIIKKAIKLYNANPQSAHHSDDGLTLSDIVADERVKAPQDEMIENDNLKHVYQLMEEMDPRDAAILKMRFGLDDTEPMTLKEIGETLGLTRERVRQIESTILKRLARSLNGEAA